MFREKMKEELDAAVKAAKKAGEVLEKYSGQPFRVLRKSFHELVSEVDLKAQAAIFEVLQTGHFDYGMVTEERTHSGQIKGINWIIDPLDGTHNYVAGLPFSGVSIALAREDDLLLGVIYFPAEDLLFQAVKGDGAYKNGERISVSKNDELAKAVVNFDNQFHLSEESFVYYKQLVNRAFTTRIFGTASMDLCLIASGKIDGRIFLNTKIPDIAAGHVIVTEAGGRLTNFDGTRCDLNSRQVVASNGGIHAQLLEIVKGEGE
jgi:myo-inositol-1(or 4)-monophosphatase